MSGKAFEGELLFNYGYNKSIEESRLTCAKLRKLILMEVYTAIHQLFIAEHEFIVAENLRGSRCISVFVVGGGC